MRRKPVNPRSLFVRWGASVTGVVRSIRRRPVNPLTLAITAVMTTLVFVLTRLVQVPTLVKGYVHLGDVGVFFAALAFGPWVGAVSGGLGTALADLTSGPYAAWAPASLLIHGVEGWLVGWIWSRWSEIVVRARSTRARRSEGQEQAPRPLASSAESSEITGMIASAFVGGICVVGGYFVVEALPFVLGPGAALGEVLPNILQVVAGALVGIPLYIAVRQAYPPLSRLGRRRDSI